MLSMSPIELLPIISDICDEKYAAVGGMEKWNLISDDEKHVVDLFIHAGCCMYKETNSCKGGSSSMTAWWANAGVQGPIKLMNNDNTAAAAVGLFVARKRALDVSGARGVKTT